MLNIMEFPPPPSLIILRDMNWPIAINRIIGRTRDARMLTNAEVCSISSPVVETLASSRCETRSLSGSMAAFINLAVVISLEKNAVVLLLDLNLR